MNNHRAMGVLGVAALVAIVVSFVLVGVRVLDRRNTAEAVAVHAERLEEVTCAMARLVSYVPAFQFEGESRENFHGWLRSRRDMLRFVSEGVCDNNTEALLRNRVRLDNELLKGTARR